MKSKLIVTVGFVVGGSLWIAPAHANPCSGNLSCNYNPTTAPVMGSVTVYLDYWGWNPTVSPSTSDPGGEVAAIMDYLEGTAANQYLNVVTQYTGVVGGVANTPVGNPSVIFTRSTNTWVSTNTAPTSYPSQAAAETEAWSAAQHFGLTTNPNALVVVLLPPSVADRTDYCAYHGYMQHYPYPVAYAVLQYQPNAETVCYHGCTGNAGCASTTALHHELVEAMSDPNGTYNVNTPTWAAWANNLLEEIGDTCEETSTPLVTVQLMPSNTSPPYTGATAPYRFTVPPIWSNEADVALGDQGGALNDPTSCVFSYATHSDSFVIGPSSDLYRKTGTGSWVNWGSPGGGLELAGDIAAVSWGYNREDVVLPNWNGSVSGISHVYTYDGSTPIWDTWGSPLPSNIAVVGGPTIASWGNNHVDLFQVLNIGGSPNQIVVYTRDWDAGTDSGWLEIGAPTYATLTSAISMTSWGPDRIDGMAFCTGSSGSQLCHLQGQVVSGSLVYTWDNTNTYVTPTTPLALSHPGVGSWGANRFDTYYVDYNGNLQHLAWDGVAWAWDSSWGNPGEYLVGSPSVTGMGAGVPISSHNSHGRLLALREVGWVHGVRG